MKRGAVSPGRMTQDEMSASVAAKGSVAQMVQVAPVSSEYHTLAVAEP